jgi:argininosuccinate lyase
MAERSGGPAGTGGTDQPHQMWGGRFAAGPAAALDHLNRSLPVDHRLWPQDVRVARAWVEALRAAGVLDAAEAALLAQGLDRVSERLTDGAARGAPDEDVHTLVERLLYEAVGAPAGKLNTGRSRNDQVATDLRLWTMEALAAIDQAIADLGRALCRQAAAGLDLVLPGYTHGQRAQPVRWGYVLLAHAWPLTRDRARLAAAAARMSELPLGSGAVAGSGIAVDRDRLARALDFARVAPSALDVTGDRDFVAECLFGLALLGTHVSRLAGELVTYASAEYGFIRLADEFCTGSSLLPQKRNPDVFELARAKAARTLGDLVALLATLKGLPAGYSKDLQEDKAFLFDAVDTMAVVLPAVEGAVETLQPVPARMRAALDPSLLATDLADGLVLQGIPFREAHALVGRLVTEAEALGTSLREFPAARAAGIHPGLADLVGSLGDWEDSVERRATKGGASRSSVQHQLRELQRQFGGPAGDPR